MHLKLAALAVAIVIATCGPSPDLPEDAGASANPDSGTTLQDAGSSDDAGAPDAGAFDGGAFDASTPPDAGDPYIFEVTCQTGYGYFWRAEYQSDGGCVAGLLYVHTFDGGIAPLITGSQVGGILSENQRSDAFPWYSITFDVGACLTPSGGYPNPPMPNPWRTKTVIGASVACQ